MTATPLRIDPATHCVQMEEKKVTCHLCDGPLDRQTVLAIPKDMIVQKDGGLTHEYARQTGCFYRYVRSWCESKFEDTSDRLNSN